MAPTSLRERLLPLAFWGLSAVVLLAFFVGYLVVQARPAGTLATVGSLVASVVGAGVLLAAAVVGVVMTVRPATFVPATPATVSAALETDGVVQLRGTATAAGWTVEAPFSGEACLAYRWVAEAEEVTTRLHELVDTQWNVKAGGQTAVPFMLTGDDGETLVAAHLDGLDLRLVESAAVTAADASDRPARIQRFCEEHGIALEGRQRFRESRLQAGEPVLVRGQVVAPATFQQASDLQLPAGTDAVVTPPESQGLVARLNPFRVWRPFLVSNAPDGERAMRGDSSVETYRERVEAALGADTRPSTRITSEGGMRRLGALLLVTALAVSLYGLGWPL